jgi:1-acyl-sn-glycerol-3-phosphate acyltransferase
VGVHVFFIFHVFFNSTFYLEGELKRETGSQIVINSPDGKIQGSTFYHLVLGRLFAQYCFLGYRFDPGQSLLRQRQVQHYCMRRWSKDNLWLSRSHLEIEGLENLDPERPVILVANHSGLHDILSLAASLPIQFRWIAKKSLFRVPFMGWHMRRSGYIAIDRDNPRETAKGIVKAAGEIRNGISAIIFPEGTRSRAGILGRFYSGAFTLALRTGVPLIPVTIEGSHRVIVPMTMQVNPGVIIRIRIGTPIDLSPYGKSEKNQLMEDVFQIMSRDLEELRARKKADEEHRDAVSRWIRGRRPPVEESRQSTAGNRQ